MSEDRSRIAAATLGCAAVFAASGATTASTQDVGWASPVVICLFVAAVLCLSVSLGLYEVVPIVRRGLLVRWWRLHTKRTYYAREHSVREWTRAEAARLAERVVMIADQLDHFIRQRQLDRRKLTAPRLTKFDTTTLRLYHERFSGELTALLEDAARLDVKTDTCRREVMSPKSLTHESDLPRYLREMAYDLRQVAREYARRTPRAFTFKPIR